MRLKNTVLVVRDLERSRKFYRDLFGLERVAEQEGTMILTQGLVLQDAAVWKTEAGLEAVFGNYASMLYFEDRDPERFAKDVKAYDPDVVFVLPVTFLPGGQKILRFCDPDGHLIEVRNPF